MKTIAPSINVLLVGFLMRQSTAFVAVERPTATPFFTRPPKTNNHHQRLSVFTASDATEIENIQQGESGKELLAVESAAESSFAVQQLLGVSTATAIFSYLILSHSDTSLFQSISPTLQHLATNAFSQTWEGYQTVLAESPIATKAATSATVYTIGDLVAQKTEGLDELDKGRVLRSMLAGGIGHGPISHFWYGLSEGFFNNIVHWTDWWSFLPKIVVDQTVFGPIWNSSYILLIGLMKKESLEKMVGDAKSSIIPLFLDGLKLWPLVHCITYGLIPVENRLLWVDLVEIVWVSILATKAASMDQQSEEGKPATAER